LYIFIILDHIDLLDEKRTTHQGIKLTKIINGYEPSEEALKNIREFYKKDTDQEGNDNSTDINVNAANRQSIN
jgi:hypothetical protein